MTTTRAAELAVKREHIHLRLHIALPRNLRATEKLM